MSDNMFINPFKYRAKYDNLLMFGSPHSSITVPYRKDLDFILSGSEVSSGNLAALTEQERSLFIKEKLFITWKPMNDQLLDRQLGFFSLCSENPFAVQQRLADSTVAVLGLGGLGSQAAYLLTTAGIGKLILVDFDVIERSNLNRQLLYNEHSLGRLKTAEAEAALLRLNPALKIETHNTRLLTKADVLEVIRGANFVVRAVDQPMHVAFEIDEACKEQGIPHLGGGFAETTCVAGPLCFPNSIPLNAAITGHEFVTPEYFKGPIVGPLTFWLSSLIVSDILRYLTDLGEPVLLNKIMVLDWITGKMFVQDA